jgi:CDP-glucose 4,6-dehydratase
LLEAEMKKHQIDTVFHAAGQAIVGIANRNPVMTFETNVQGTWGLLEACRQTPSVRQFVMTSTDKVYGDQPDLPSREEMALAGRHPYEVSKACADMIATSYANSYRLPIAVTRCGNFFGAGDLNWNRIIPGTIRSLLAGERPVIRSDGNYVRDYLYADEAAGAHMLLAHRLAGEPHLAGEAFNFSHEVRLTVLDVVEQISRLMNSPLTPEVRNEASMEIRAQYLSSAKAREYLGWKAELTMEQGLQSTIDWYKGYLAEPENCATRASTGISQ